MNDAVLLDVQEGIGLITLNRPESLNTFTAPMIAGLSESYRECDRNDAVRVVIVTGTGTAFCAGADMSTGGDSFDGADGEPDFSSCPLGFQAWEVRKPVIAACNGHAVGVGLGVALQADLRIFAEEGKYGLLQTRRGVVADFAVEYLLPRLIGFERSFELIVRGQRLSGTEAGQWGLASRVLPAAGVLDCALGIARDMVANCSPLVMGLHKRMLWKALDMPLERLVELETRALHYSAARPDALEGGMSYLQRRPPVWRTQLNTDWPQWME